MDCHFITAISSSYTVHCSVLILGLALFLYKNMCHIFPKNYCSELYSTFYIVAIATNIFYVSNSL